MGQCSELPRGMGQTSPVVAWKTLLKRANTILKLTGVCLLLKSPSLATVREVMKMSRGSGDSLHSWHRHKPRMNQTCTDCWSQVLFALRLRLYLPGRWASSQGPSQVRGCTARLWHAATPDVDWSLRRSTGLGLRRLSAQRWP